MFRYAVCASPGAALSEPVLYRGSLEKVFGFAAGLGFDGVEIHLRDASEVDGALLAALSERSGVRVAAVATGLARRVDGLTMIDPDAGARRRCVERLKGHIDLAAEFGCPVVVGSTRGSLPSGEEGRTAYRRLVESVRELAQHIGDRNCSITFEAINRYENNYLNTAAETAAFLDDVGDARVGMLLDTYHMNIEEPDLCMAFWRQREKVSHIHLSENTRRFPGSGAVDFRRFLQTLQTADYRGWLSLECLPLPDEETAAGKGLAYMKMIEEMVREAAL